MSVPNAITLANLKLAILRYLKLEDDSDADTMAAYAIRSGLVRLAAYPLKSMLSTSVLTLTTSGHTLSLPSDFNMAYSLHLLDTSSKRAGRLTFFREEDFDQVFPDSEGVAGTPEAYTVRDDGSVLEMNATPSTQTVAAWPTVRLRYFKRVEELTTATSTFSLAPEIEEFLIWFGRAHLAAIYDSKMYALAAQESSRCLLDAIKRDTIVHEQDWA